MEEIVDCCSLSKSNALSDKSSVKDFTITKKDKIILKNLAQEKADIADNLIHVKKIKMWEYLNDLKEVRPLIWINEIPWHEMNFNDELTLKTDTMFAKFLETRLRRTIYQWKHMPGDMVVEPTLPCYLIINNTGFGIYEKVEIAKTDKDSDVYSRVLSNKSKMKKI